MNERHDEKDFEFLKRAKLKRQTRLNAIEDAELVGEIAQNLREEANQLLRNAFIALDLEQPDPDTDIIS